MAEQIDPVYPLYLKVPMIYGCGAFSEPLVIFLSSSSGLRHRWYTDNRLRKGKSAARWRRKATGLLRKAAGPPKGDR